MDIWALESLTAQEVGLKSQTTWEAKEMVKEVLKKYYKNVL